MICDSGKSFDFGSFGIASSVLVFSVGGQMGEAGQQPIVAISIIAHRLLVSLRFFLGGFPFQSEADSPPVDLHRVASLPIFFD